MGSSSAPLRAPTGGSDVDRVVRDLTAKFQGFQTAVPPLPMGQANLADGDRLTNLEDRYAKLRAFLIRAFGR